MSTNGAGAQIHTRRRLFLAQSLTKYFLDTTIVVEHKDQATRFGFRYVQTLMHGQGRTLEVVNLAEHDREDLLHDLIAVIYSFAARLYGQRRAKRKTEAIVAQLRQAEQEGIGETGRAASDPQA